MSFLGPMLRFDHAHRFSRPWLDWPWHRPGDIESALHRRIGRRVKVGTECGIKSGRLVEVARDFIVLRVKRRRTLLIRIDAICWVRLKRRRRRHSRPKRSRSCRCWA